MKLCPFCHSWVSENLWDSHERSHTRLLPDGQMQDHVTVRPEERYTGSIDKEPQWYFHTRCGAVTGMPEEIIRSYLADPFLYNDTSFCTGCGTYVPTSELFWQGSNESLLAADRRRKLEFIQRYQLNQEDFIWDIHGPVKRKSRGGGWGCVAAAAGGAAALLLVGFVFVFALIAIGAEARQKRAQAAFPAGLNRNVARPEFAAPDMPKLEIPKGPDMSPIMRDHEERMEQIRKQHEEMLHRLQSEPLGIPPSFDPLDRPDSPDPYSSMEEARRRSEEALQRAEERMESARQRFRQFP